MPAPRLEKKISPAVLYPNGLPRLDVEGAAAELNLFTVYGMANGIKTGTTDKGEWLSFRGQFEAMMPNGETIVSGNVFLPQPFQDMLHSQLNSAQQNDAKASVEFAVRVFIVPPKKGKPSATGYEYRCEPIVEMAESSPILKLRSAVLQKTMLLQAPKNPAEAAKAEQSAASAPAPAAQGGGKK
jgi:hypothetical protein